MVDLLVQIKTALAPRYEVEREIGSGGMATVYRARDSRHERQVAVKVLRSQLAAALGSDRFLREIRITARLNHPHILPLLDSGEAAGFLYYVMPYVAGGSLRRRLSDPRALALDDALRIARQVATALDYAHRHQVIHRDVKPENILFSEGLAVVADFGIARAVTAAGPERLTRSGMPVGTPGYMSPEQAMGITELDERTDVYSLGCVTYEMLVGATPKV
ncbi:MAG: protein kinase, partial [Gammaproteobacteria bacterium]|nr:protein kinase [Gammaproteobacteria bacterium]